VTDIVINGVPTYTLTINVLGSGAVLKDPDQASYRYGEAVTLTASADPGWIFSGWSGDLSGSGNPESIFVNDHKTVTATFTQEPAVLSLKKWVSRDRVYAGSRLDYALVVSNTGGYASQLVVSDALPAGTAYGGCSCAVGGTSTVSKLSVQGSGNCGAPYTCSLEGTTIVWRVSEITGNLSLQLNFWVMVDPGLSDGSVIINDDYAVVADGLAPLVVNRPVTTTVREMIVSVSNVAWPDPVSVGQQLWYTITVRNDGGLLQNLLVTDLLPSGVSFVSCGGALCQLGGGSGREVIWWLPTLPATNEQQLTLRVAVNSVPSGTLVNAFYGVWIPATCQGVMGAPVAVQVLTLPGWQDRLYLPIALSNATG
jgi:uncharacterized repeat protein (TIGR01451 family)